MKQSILHLSVLILALIVITISCKKKGKSIQNYPFHAPLVEYVGSLRNTIKKGKLERSIHLSQLVSESNVYGLGPLEFLTGEIMLLNDSVYVSTVEKDTSISVNIYNDIRAPFFVYATVDQWDTLNLVNVPYSINDIESFFTEVFQDAKHPIVFRIIGELRRVNFHVLNLPKGTSVSSHEEAHQGVVSRAYEKIDGEVLGFYSTGHHGIFTHHDSNLHMHFMTENRSEMGHVDSLAFDTDNVIILKGML